MTNTNRQLHAMKGTLGKLKVEVMAERLRAINPDATVETRREFYSDKNADRLLTPEPDIVVDAIDNVKAKLHLIATCIRQRLRLVSSMGAAARLDPSKVRVADLAQTRVDPFARHLRKDLRRKFGVDCSRPVGVLAVYSEETPRAPARAGLRPGGLPVRLSRADTTACTTVTTAAASTARLPFVPATFGMTLAATAVQLLVANPIFPEVSAPSTAEAPDLSFELQR